MKTAADAGPGRLRSWAVAAAGLARRDPIRTAALGVSIAASLAALVLFSPSGPLSARGDLSGFEAGKVADRDLTADRDAEYLDQIAMDAAAKEREAAVKPVFTVDESVKASAMARFAEFRDFALGSAGPSAMDEAYLQSLRAKLPGALSREEALAIRDAKSPAGAFSMAEGFLNSLFDAGIAAIPEKGLERFAQASVELRSYRDGAFVAEELPLRGLITVSSWPSELARIARQKLSDPSYPAARVLVKAFIAENLFFDRDSSEQRLLEARDSVEPIVRKIAKGDRIVKKGYLVDAEQIQRIKALGADKPGLSPAYALGAAGFVLLAYAFGLVLMGNVLAGTKADRRDYLVLVGAATLYFGLGIFASRVLPSSGPIPFAVILPTALIAVLVTILHDGRTAVVFTLLLSLSLLGIDGAGAMSALAAFFSGVAGILGAQNAEKRMDLVKAGLFLALFQSVLVLVLTALSGKTGPGAWQGALWAGINGLLCGVLALGFLPVLEGLLNAPTRFRLMELSDLNSPLLKRLLTLAPGTYSHSVMVANLAESACRDIGADALLARVASYYHDVGKMDQPDYFVENQTSYNKHNALKPRLSATVIRSHVKVGVEKARAINLPEEVVDVISQHHGDGLIAYFYNQALKEEGQADKDDFSYPGTPPKSKEAAVVMLADSVEAASRTLKKPTPAKLGQFVDEIIMDKFRNGMLDLSALTFRDLAIIKDSFLRILGGHYHSRIEYPKAPPEGPKPNGAGERP